MRTLLNRDGGGLWPVALLLSALALPAVGHATEGEAQAKGEEDSADGQHSEPEGELAEGQTEDSVDGQHSEPEGLQPEGQDEEVSQSVSGRPAAEEAARVGEPEAQRSALSQQPDVAEQLFSLQRRTEQLEAELQRLKRPRRGSPAPRLRVELGGRLQTDLRFRPQQVTAGDWYNREVLAAGLSRAEVIAKLKVNARVGRFQGVFDLDFVLRGKYPQPESLATLSNRSAFHPFRIEAHSAYLQVRDLIAPGLDLRVGQQLVMWGVGDQFNPTNNLNADDIEDPLLFGDQQGNLMVRVDYTLKESITFNVVLVPIFKPALLPATSSMGSAAVDRLPFADEAFRHRVHSESALSEQFLGFPTVLDRAIPVTPELSVDNMQFAVRAATSIFGQDLAVSFYRGRFDFPQPFLNHSVLDETPRCEGDPPPPFVRYDEPAQGERCINGLIRTTTWMEYPRINVLGFNWAGEMAGIGIGYRFELGVYFPEQQTLTILKPEISLDPSPPGEYDYDLDGEAGGAAPEVSSGSPFAKWTLGFDYSIGPVMLNAQWVHGMVDEFGRGDFITPGSVVRAGDTDAPVLAEEQGAPNLFECGTSGDGQRCAREILRPRIADYLVLGVDFRFARNAALFRLFTLWDLSGYESTWWDDSISARVSEHKGPFSDEGFSAVIYPEFQYNFGGGLELHVGALLQFGRAYTKFGDPAGGGHQIFLRGRYSF